MTPYFYGVFRVIRRDFLGVFLVGTGTHIEYTGLPTVGPSGEKYLYNIWNILEPLLPLSYQNILYETY